MSNIFCILPAYNEAKTIARIVAELKLEKYGVIVVDDGSGDDTALLARKSGAIVLRHIINRGQGAALQTGNEFALKAGADIIVHFDADGQFLAKEINEIVGPIVNKKADIVFGSRFLDKKSVMPRAKKFFLIPLARLVNLAFFQANLTDPQCGFRALSRQSAGLITIEQDGMAHCSEIIAKAFNNKLKINEVPVTVIYQNFGLSLSGGIRIIFDLLIGKITN